jgi:hypothetical protein
LAYEINKKRMATTQFKQNMLQSKVMMQKVSKAADYFNASMMIDVDNKMRPRRSFDLGVDPNIKVDDPAENSLMKGLGIFSMCNNIGAFCKKNEKFYERSQTGLKDEVDNIENIGKFVLDKSKPPDQLDK